jgi:hypothetical protein
VNNKPLDARLSAKYGFVDGNKRKSNSKERTLYVICFGKHQTWGENIVIKPNVKIDTQH